MDFVNCQKTFRDKPKSALLNLYATKLFLLACSPHRTQLIRPKHPFNWRQVKCGMKLFIHSFIHFFSNFSGYTVEVWEWISTLMISFIMGVISYLCWDYMGFPHYVRWKQKNRQKISVSDGIHQEHLQWIVGPSGPRLNMKTVFPGMGMFMLKIRRSRDILILRQSLPPWCVSPAP